MPIGALFGSPIGGLMADKTGRKSVLAASGIPNFLGWLVIVLSYYSRSAWTFKLLILIGRFLTGFASGCLTSAVPVSYVYYSIAKPCIKLNYASATDFLSYRDSYHHPELSSYAIFSTVLR